MERPTSDKSFYRHVASKYRKVSRLRHLWYPDCRTIIPEMDLDDDLQILDVGCGNGRLMFTLAGFLPKCEFYAIDSSISAIKKCIRKNKNDLIKFSLAAAEKLPFGDEYFDIITCTNTFHLLPQRVRAIDEMHRVLKPGGKMFLLEGIYRNDYKQKFDKILRQTKFIRPQKKFLLQSAILNKSYLVIATREHQNMARTSSMAELNEF